MSPGLNPVLASTHEFEQFIDSQRRNLSPGNQQRVQSKKSDSRNAARMQSGRRVAQYESAPRTQSWSGGTDDTLLTVSGRSAEHTTDRIAQRSALASSFIPSSASSSSSSSALSSKSSRASLRDVELQEDPYGWLRGAAPASTSTYGIAKDMPAPVLPANADNVAARRRHHARRGFEVRGPEQSWDIYYSYHERQKPGKEKEDWDFLDESKSPSASSSSSSSTNSNSNSRGRPDDILRYGHNHLAGHLLDPQPQTERPAQTLDSALIKLLAPTSPHGHDYGHSRDGDGDGDGDGSPSFPRPVQHSDLYQTCAVTRDLWHAHSR